MISRDTDKSDFNMENKEKSEVGVKSYENKQESCLNDKTETKTKSDSKKSALRCVFVWTVQE